MYVRVLAYVLQLYRYLVIQIYTTSGRYYEHNIVYSYRVLVPYSPT